MRRWRFALLGLGTAMLAGCGPGVEVTPEADAPQAAATAGSAALGPPGSAAADHCRPEQLLARPPFSATDIALFDTYTHPAAPAMVPATAVQSAGRPPLEQQVQQALAPRAARHPGVIARAMAVLQAPAVRDVVVVPELRAALAILVGTLGESAVHAFDTGDYTQVHFADIEPPAWAIYVHDDRSIRFALRYRYEDIRALAAALAHEVLHSDGVVSHKEELISGVVDAAVWGQFLLEDPRLAEGGTELVRRLNGKLMGLLNTRDGQGGQRLLAGPDVFPESSVDLAGFGANYLPLGADTPGNGRLDAVLSAITGRSISGADFDDETVRLLDTAQAWASPGQRIRLATILRLELPDC